MKTLLRNARILTMKDKTIFHGDIIVKDNKISYIGESKTHTEQFDKVIDCENNLLLPGFKNAHTHSAMTFVRSKSDDLALHDWLFKEIFPYEEHLTPNDIKPLAKLAFLEYLTSGITACLDQYFFPETYLEAAEDFGMRTLNISIYNKKDRDIEEFKRLYNKYNSTEDSLTRFGICIHADYTTSKEDLIKTKEIIDSLGGIPFYTHLGETIKEKDDAYKNYGCSQTEYLNSLGLFDYGGAIFHGVYLNDNDLDILKEKGVSIVTNPGSNTKLASGIADVEHYIKKGLNVAIGTDGPASNNCLDFFKEMLLVSSLAKVSKLDPTAMPAYEVLKMATVNGAKAMGLNDCDVLDINKKADIIMIDMNQPNMHPVHNIINNLVYSGSKLNIKMTMIDGKILYYNHQFLIDDSVEEIYKEANKIAQRIIKETVETKD